MEEKRIPNGFGGYSTRKELRDFIQSCQNKKARRRTEFDKRIRTAQRALN